MDTTRIDRWLWSVRLCKTRSDATALCRAGHVRLNGEVAKPASRIGNGDRIEARTHGIDRSVEVLQVIENRVGAAVAAQCYADHTPPAPPREARVAPREPGSGRPTKRDRRTLERWRDASR